MVQSWLVRHTTGSRDVDRPANQRFRRFDVGPCLGVGVALPAGFGVSVRAYRGLLQSSQEADSQTPYPMTYVGRLYQQQLQASLTYQLHGD